MAKTTNSNNSNLVKIALGVAVVAVALSVWNYLKTPKVAYVETPVLMTQFSEANEARKVFEDEQKKWDKVLAEYQDSIKAQVDYMKKNFDKAPQGDQDNMRKKLGQIQSAFEDYQGRVRMMSQKKENELMQPVLEKANQFLKQWGKDKGYDLVLGTMNGGSILYANDKLNVTAELVKDMNAFYGRLPQASPEKVIKK